MTSMQRLGDRMAGSTPVHPTQLVVRPGLRVAELQKVFDGVPAVDALSFDVAPGEILGLVGPNGAGKTTTLRCVAGILVPTKGAVEIGGYALRAHPVEAKRQLAFLPDEPRLFDHLTVWEHLNFMARLYGVLDWQEKARALLFDLELAGKNDALPPELSRGMKQKLSIACGFLHDPKLVLLDEPLTGLDPVGMRKMKDALAARARAGAAMVLSSHLLGLIEELCDRVLIVDRGRAVALGSIQEIRSRLAGPDDASLEDLFIRITSPGDHS
jgi:ABC-2 type transport system ATP-binding protein